MRVLIIVPQQPRTSGNWVTALRFRQGLQQLGCDVIIHEVALDGAQELAGKTSQFNPDVVLLLHAYRTGRPWLESHLSLPCIVMLTGTDQNQGLNDGTQKDTILKIMQEVSFIAIQNPILATDLANKLPDIADKIRTPSPGITLGGTPYALYEKHSLSEDLPLFLCPAGLRPVKGVLELIEMFGQLCTSEPLAQLAICGPILDASYGQQCLAAIAEKSWAHYLGAIPTDAMASVMRQADVIVNNSFTEGLSNTLLEAITLGRPILARNIAGNSAIVAHGVNGFLYDNLSDFKNCVEGLLRQTVRAQLSHPEPDKYSQEKEAGELLELLTLAKGNHTCDC